MAYELVDKALDLVTRALEELDRPDCRVSAVVHKAIRIARLLNDYDNLWWLQVEMIPRDSTGAARLEVLKEVVPHYTKESYEFRRGQVTDAYVEERKIKEVGDYGMPVGEDGVCVLSVPEMEEQIAELPERLDRLYPRDGLHHVDVHELLMATAEARRVDNGWAQQMSTVLHRIRYRVHGYLSITEKRLVERQLNSDVFERNRTYVDIRLQDLSPDALQQLQSAYRRVGEGDSESRSHALLSCRRALKSIADRLYPPRVDLVAGADGKERDLGEDKYVNRLWQYVSDKAEGHASGDLLLSQISYLGNRIDAVYDLSCKGAHADVSEFEANQCVIQTYLIVGDILRLAEGESAIGSETEEEDGNAGSVTT